MKKRVLIMGAAGRTSQFQRSIGTTPTTNGGIHEQHSPRHRRKKYPSALAGKLYPNGFQSTQSPISTGHRRAHVDEVYSRTPTSRM